jgi:murein L,D-transpeptidase YafK
MHIIPFHTEKGLIKGCQMIWLHGNAKGGDEWKSFNMFDQESNNIYRYKSQIINGGVKR